MHTISGVVPFLIAHVARTLGADPEPLLRGTGVDEIFGFLAMSCATIGEAFDRTLQYSQLYTVGALYAMDVDREATRITWLPWPGDLHDSGYRAAMDYHLANMEQAIRQLGKSPPRPLEVRLRHAAPRDVAKHVEFYGVAPKFGCPRYELVYPPALRDVKVATFNSRLRDYFDLECRCIREARRRDRLRGIHLADGLPR